MILKKGVIGHIKDWEIKNLAWGKGYYTKKIGGWYHKSLSGQLAPTGADVYRISQGITRKFGLKYRQVWIGYIRPASQGDGIKHNNKNKMIPKKVDWYSVGYVKAGKTTGTFKLCSLTSWSKSALKRFGIK